MLLIGKILRLQSFKLLGAELNCYHHVITK